MWAIGKWVGGALLDYAVGVYQGTKKEQKLDPVATICMLAFGALEIHDNAKPSVNSHRFYFDKPGALQGATRKIYKASHDDIGLLEPCIKLFVKHWEPKPNSDLYLIVTIALRGLENIAKTYKQEYATVDVTLNAYTNYLTVWQNEAWQASTEIPSEEREFISKIREIWDEGQLKLILQFLKSNSTIQLDLLLAERNTQYQKLVHPEVPEVTALPRTLIPPSAAAAASSEVRDESI